MQNIIGWLVQLGPWGLTGVMLVGVVLFVALAMHAEQQRTKAMLALAETLGFEFKPSVPWEMVRRWPQFQLFASGKAQQVKNLLSGATDSTRVQIFDWIYVTGGGKNHQTHKTTVVVIEADDLDLPAFFIRPETMLDWVGLTFDGKDIDFEDRPLFSKKFHLHGNLENRVRKLFDVEVCEFFESHLGMYAEGSRQWLVYYQNDNQVTPENLQDRFKEAFQLYVLLKARSDDAASGSSDSATAVSDERRDQMSAEAE